MADYKVELYGINLRGGKMDIVEILGYMAMLFVSGSFLLKDVIKLRIVNSIGAICFVIYGFIIGAIPVAVLNVFVTGVNAYYIIKSFKEKT